MNNDEKNKAYKEYMQECWKEAEQVARSVGVSSNEGVGIFFKMICSPRYYWSQNR